MKRSLLLACVFALVSTAGKASAAPCTVSSLADYVTLGSSGCAVGDISFSAFSVEAFPGPGALQIDAGSVFLAPVPNGLSLASGSNQTASAGELMGLRFGFRVSASAGLTGGAVSLVDTSVTPDGVITAILDAGTAGNAIAFDTGDIAEPLASFTGSAFGFFDVFYELGVDGGLSGQAIAGPNLGSVTFAVVPEPGTLPLMLGLLSLLLLRPLRRTYGRS
jgi:hypothetical protein